MNSYIEFRSRLESDSTLPLLRLDQAPLFLSFLHAVYRLEHAVSRSEGELVDRLSAFLEQINEQQKPPPYPKNAGYYLDYWVSKDVLRRRHTESLQVVYDLTPATERAIAFVQGIERKETVGADSKLNLIAQTLQDLSENSDPDVERRHTILENKIKAIREEIHALNMGAPPHIYSSNEKRERYRLAVDLARDLQRDFGVIRERFKALARTIAADHASTGVNRGDVLRRALDENAVLRRSPEGQSFSAFYSFLLDPTSQAELRKLVDEVEQLEEIDPADKASRFLRNLPGILLLEAKSVVETNERLSEQLRRVLDSATARSRAEARSVIREIMAYAFEIKEAPPETLISFYTTPNFKSAEATVRPLWREPAEPPPLAAAEAASGGDADALASDILDLATVDFERLQKQIAEGFERLGNGFMLHELVEAFPSEPGVAILDILGYLELARRDPSNHRWPESRRFLVPLQGTSQALRVPDIEFYQFK